MALKLNEWVVVGSASQTKPVDTSQGTVNFTLTYYLEAMLTSQSVALNQWSGKCRARVTRSGGQTYSSSMTASCTHCPNYSGVVTPEATLTTGTFTLYGNDAGESALHLVGSLTAVIGGFSISVDSWASAPTIPRSSKPTFSSDPLTIGQTQTITTNRASSSFTHTLKIDVGGYSETITGVGEFTTWTPSTATLMPYMDTWQKNVTVTCTTYNGSTVIGSTTSSFTLQVDTSVYKPNITWGTATDTNATTSALETAGSFIKGFSNLQIQVTSAPNNTTYGDTVEKLVVALGNVSQQSAVGGLSVSVNFMANGITTATLTATATDNRGYTVTETVTLTLLDYSSIQIQSVEHVRVNANDVETETGEYVRYTVKANAFLGSFGAVTNTITVTTQSKLASAGTYGSTVTEKTVTTSGSGVGEITITGITVGTYSPLAQFDIKFTLTDALSSATTAQPVRVHEGIPVVAWGADHFDVYGEFHVHNRNDVSDYMTLTWQGDIWNLVGTASGGNSVAFGSGLYNAKEIMFEVSYTENSTYTWTTHSIIPVYVFTSANKYEWMGARIALTTGGDFGCVVRYNNTDASIFEINSNRTSVLSNATLKVYYR